MTNQWMLQAEGTKPEATIKLVSMISSLLLNVSMTEIIRLKLRTLQKCLDLSRFQWELKVTESPYTFL